MKILDCVEEEEGILLRTNKEGDLERIEENSKEIHNWTENQQISVPNDNWCSFERKERRKGIRNSWKGSNKRRRGSWWRLRLCISWSGHCRRMCWELWQSTWILHSYRFQWCSIEYPSWNCHNRLGKTQNSHSHSKEWEKKEKFTSFFNEKVEGG